MPLLEHRMLEIHSFPHFSLTCFDILSGNFAYDFVLLYYRLCLSVVNFRYCCWSYAPYNLGYLNTQFSPHFSLTCFNILSWKFAYDFVFLYYRSASSLVNLRQLLLELCPFWNLVIHTFLLHALTYWAEILHMAFFYCTTDQGRVSSICTSLCRRNAPFELRILKIHSFLHVSLTCFDILSWNFAYDFVLLYYRSSSSVVILRQLL